jgi:hypothetical protein
MKLRALVIASALALAISAPAQGAEPSSGEVSPSSPTVSWTGTIEDPTGAYDTAFWFAGAMGPSCQQPACDTFGLDVAAGGTTLTIKVTGSGAENVAFEVEDPDGETVYVDSEDTELRPSRERAFGAKPGAWVIRISGTGSFEYNASATLSGGAPAPAPGGGSQQPPPQQSPPSGGEQPPAQQPPPPPGSGDGAAAAPPSPTVTVKAPSRKARSARRLRKGRSLTVGVTSSAPLRDVTAVLVPARRQTRVLGSGRTASLTGSGRVRIKLARTIRRGRYVILVSGLDEQGRRATARRAVTVIR